ncbi:MAG: RdgB/HAM1 family non-canonical purine NTP pyrophosphatase [Hyphomicrobiales bacterium]|nr:RdgB/HAM1 family non-canonical purine NTP pyrophosphatase [Hyphomicrobiales bacterium]
MRALKEGKLVVASHNQGKVREMRDLLAPFAVETIAADDLSLAEPTEAGDTFAANARLKAMAAAKESGLPAVADDSGLVVDALGGAPGIYSARWAGPKRDFSKAMEGVELELRAQAASGKTSRRARFVCALCLAWPDGHAEAFEGEVEGALIWPPRGDKGFGYDPMFVADGQTETFGEMEPARKHAMSHRARAFKKLIDGCLGKT